MWKRSDFERFPKTTVTGDEIRRSMDNIQPIKTLVYSSGGGATATVQRVDKVEQHIDNFNLDIHFTVNIQVDENRKEFADELGVTIGKIIDEAKTRLTR